MKILNIENGIEKIYVQLNDIAMLNYISHPIPPSISKKVFEKFNNSTKSIIVNNSNRMNFLEFTDQTEINFFKSLDWIIDYKEIRNLTEKEIIKNGQKLAEEIKNNAIIYNNLSLEERKNNKNMIIKHQLLNYKMRYLTEIIWLKQGKKQMPFPLAIDSDGFTFSESANPLYEIKSCLEPNKLLLYRKDGFPLSVQDLIPENIFQTAMTEALINEQKNFFGIFETSRTLSKDHQYLIAEVKIENYVQETNLDFKLLDKNETLKIETKTSKKSSIKKLLKIFLTKKKKKENTLLQQSSN